MKRLLILLMLVSQPAWAEQDTVRLICNGKWSNFEDPSIRDVNVDGVYVEIQANAVRVIGTPISGDLAYRISRQDPRGIAFIAPSGVPESPHYGFVNRFTGELNLSRSTPNGRQFLYVYRGSCERRQPVF